jgi:hypothetical protein
MICNTSIYRLYVYLAKESKIQHKYYVKDIYCHACVMCAAFDNRSFGVATEYNTHSAKTVPNNLFSVHGTS